MQIIEYYHTTCEVLHSGADKRKRVPSERPIPLQFGKIILFSQNLDFARILHPNLFCHASLGMVPLPEIRNPPFQLIIF